MADATLTVKVYNDQKQLQEGEITMSFGLLGLLAAEVGDINRVGIVDVDPDLAMSILAIVLVPRNAKGKSAAPEGWEPPDMPLEEAEKIFAWVKEHVLDFFIRRLQNTVDLMSQNKDRLRGIGSFLNGSEASASATASSGLST